MSLTLSNTSFFINGQLKFAYYDSAYVPGSGSDNTVERDSTKPVVVLLHGYCGSSAYFSKLIALLSPSYRLLIPDLIGHGVSDAASAPVYGLKEQAAYVRNWLQGIRVAQAYVFGHSLGGYITLELARQYPDLLLGFGLLHSTGLPDTEQAKSNRELAIKTVEEHGVAAFVDGLVPKLLAADHPQHAELLQVGVSIGYQTAAAAAIGFARGMKERQDNTAVIENSSKPVLLIAGAKDNVVRPEATFAGRGRSSSCHVIEQAAHMGMLEEPEQTASIIQQFIGV